MANSRTFKLEQIKEGDIVFVSVCTQCASTAEITFKGLKDAIELKKEKSDIALTRLDGTYTSTKIGSEPLEFTITIHNGDNEKMKVIQCISILSDKNGKEQGLNYVFNIEDVQNGDEDFNDYYINVVAWHKKG